ncbi:MAG: hypothetical protein CMM10_09855 [Rhodospirillaceae bacterium]|jgi:hypothetical protein|nr:hypothetical protein [Rhodospirillaceae bacterium]|tara:strand:- start:2385 stop:2588 length:204 start_codon:yes stop_codon:yes gene_type:complete
MRAYMLAGIFREPVAAGAMPTPMIAASTAVNLTVCAAIRRPHGLGDQSGPQAAGPTTQYILFDCHNK